MKLFLIDGHALVFKMYYAFLSNPIINSKGEDMSILFGFTKYLLELIDKEQPSHIAVSFDPPGGTFRNKLYPEYKANREETPALIVSALEPLTQLLEAMRIPVLMMKGYEADDVIGSAAKHFAAQGFEVYMVTPDKDYGQLIDKGIYQFKPGKGKGDNEIYGVREICEKWSIKRPSQVIDLLAICGDASDNVPGVQGVGPKGAAKLLDKYESLEGIYAHIGELTARQQELFRAASSHIELSKELVTIKTDIPISTSAGDMAFNMSYTAELEDLINKYEFPSLKRLVSKVTGENKPVTGNDSVMKKTDALILESRETSPESFLGAKRIAVNIVEDKIYIASAGNYAKTRFADIKDILENPDIVKVGYKLKESMNLLALSGIEMKGKIEDIELMHYLLNPERSHKLDSLAASYLGVVLEDEDNFVSASLFDENPIAAGPDKLKETLCMPALADKLNSEIDSTKGMRELYDKIEEPLLHVLSRMEQIGVKVDLSSLSDFAASLRKDMLAEEAKIRQIAEDPNLNIASPRQIGIVIFEKLKLDPKARKSKNGSWPTDETTLQELSEKSPIIDAILEYRGLRKLLSTYIEPFGGFISRIDGRVHTSFNQSLTATGRLSSSNPNLQNIPIRTEKGREIRKAFVPGDSDSVIMSADYSQIELRLMAHLCGDEHLISAFRAGHDVHSATAAKIFKIPIGQVTADQRRIAKTANFGIMYGISAFGLSQRLKCTRSEAKRIIEDYFASFPSIRGFIDRTVEEARNNGYVETLYGRRRYLPDLKSANASVRALAERNAVNAPIQGTAADIIKLAMNAVDHRLRMENLQARTVLPTHYELVLEVPLEEVETVKALLIEEMENVIKLSVPLTVECNYGKNWLEAH